MTSDFNEKYNVSCQNKAYTWPSAPLTPYFFDQEELGFIAQCHSDNISSLFSAYSNKGLIVLTAFHSIRQTDRVKKYFCREFYSNASASRT